MVGVNTGNRRRHYRISYNAGETLTFKAKDVEFPVLDLSESGLRFKAHDWTPFKLGDSVFGEVSLPGEGGAHKVSGVVVHLLARNAVALEFHAFGAMPLRAVMAEQRRLIRKRSMR